MSYNKGIRFRSVVSAWRENSEGESIDGYSVERVVCVEIDNHPIDTQRQRAREMVQAVMQLAFPQVNQFDIYNTVDEHESPAEVLGFVTGWAKGHQCYESDPIVVFRTPNVPEEHREAGALTWKQVFAMDDEQSAKASSAR